MHAASALGFTASSCTLLALFGVPLGVVGSPLRTIPTVPRGFLSLQGFLAAAALPFLQSQRPGVAALLPNLQAKPLQLSACLVSRGCCLPRRYKETHLLNLRP